MLKFLLWFSTGFQLSKNQCECSVHILRSPCTCLNFIKYKMKWTLVLSKTDDKNKAFMCIIRGRFKNYVGKQEGGVIKCLCYLILSKVVHQRGRGGQKHPKSCFSGFLKAPKSNICFDIVCFTIDPSSVFFYIGSIVCNWSIKVSKHIHGSIKRCIHWIWNVGYGIFQVFYFILVVGNIDSIFTNIQLVLKNSSIYTTNIWSNCFI